MTVPPLEHGRRDHAPLELEPLVEFRGVSKTFPNGTVALRRVSFAIQAGTCHAICGENGAGKSTLMKVLFGLEEQDSGSIAVDGVVLEHNSPRIAASLGIGMVHQHFSLVPSLSVAESVALGREPRHGPLLDLAAARREVRDLAGRYKLEVDPDASVGHLSVAAQQKVEILKALARRIRLLILDEPTAVLTPQETEELFARLEHLRAAGLTIIFISHKLREVRALASHVTVMRGGRVTGDADMAGIGDEAIARMVMGHAIPATRRRRAAGRGERNIVLEAEHLSLAAGDAADRLDDISLHIGEGEVLGVAGVEGSGQRGLVSLLTGLAHPSAGDIRLHGRAMTRASTKIWRRAGMAHLPADRFAEGGARSLSLVDNAIAGMNLGPLLSGRRAEQVTAAMIARYGVRARSPRQSFGELSGGNAQKLIAAREFSSHPRFLVADQPTRGIDIEAAAFIRARILELADGGCAVLLISADLEELLALADRLVVFFAGHIAAGFDDVRALTPERLGPFMLGLATA